MSILESGKVTASNVINQSYSNIYNLINDRDNVSDPADSTGNRKFVWTRLPNAGRNFSCFPFIVLKRTMPVKRPGNASGTYSKVDFNFSIFVYTKDSGSDADGNPEGAEQNNIISDDIIETLNNITNKKTLIDQGMSLPEFDVDTDEDEFNGKTVFVTEFDLRFVDNLTTTG